MTTLSRWAGALAAFAHSSCFEPQVAADKADRVVPPDAAQESPNRSDAGDEDNEVDGAAVSPIDAGFAKHPACLKGPEAAAPGSAEATRVDVKVQNEWRQVACASTLPFARCSRFGQDCPRRSYCMYPTLGEVGYCIGIPGNDTVENTGNFAPTSYRDGVCVAQLLKEDHAALCCEGVAGVDCEPWPRAAPSPLGSVCERDDQCERGLVCVLTADECSAPFCSRVNVHFGRCACPEASTSRISNEVSCGHMSPL